MFLSSRFVIALYISVVQILSVVCESKTTQSNHLDPIHDDANGYITFCPCMGRFGNQADQYLGAIAFSKELNRTLLLPAWVTYETGNPNSVQVPFSDLFQVEKVNEFHRSIPLETFIEQKADRIWPSKTRTVFCYSSRHQFSTGPSVDGGCNAKDGNPFGSFWNTYGVDFVASEFYGPLHYPGQAALWNEKYPAETFPVLALTGAPGAFPVLKEHRALHRYLQWSERISRPGQKFIADKLGSRPYVGIHLRNGIDWDRACEHVDVGSHFFASPQCLGVNNEHGNMYPELCMPPRHVILKQVRQALKTIRSKVLFVATDNDDMAAFFKKKIKGLEVWRLGEENPHLDLYVLEQADYYLGNCVSSFSSFVFRARSSGDRPSEFWAFPPSVLGRKQEL